jgi:hypothetical protein
MTPEQLAALLEYIDAKVETEVHAATHGSASGYALQNARESLSMAFDFKASADHG